MKKEYVSTFIEGLEEPVEAALRKTGGVSVNRIYPGLAMYKSVRDPDLPFVHRTYLLLSQMRPQKDLDSGLRQLSATDSWLDRFDFESIQGKQFRIITAENGTPVACNMRYVQRLEKNISEQTGMVSNRLRPEVELWVNLRPEGLYFLWRLGKHNVAKSADPLRRDLCEIIAFLAAPKGENATILGLTGPNLPEALASQGAGNISAVYASQIKGKKENIRVPRLHLLPGSPGYTGIEPGSQQAALLCIAPKGSFSVQEDAMRGVVREAASILKPNGTLVTFYPTDKGRVLRRTEEFDCLSRYEIVISGERCYLEVFRKTSKPLE